MPSRKLAVKHRHTVKQRNSQEDGANKHNSCRTEQHIEWAD